MTAPYPAAVLLDIEGTTTPISFVYDVLFPHARAHMKAFLAARSDALHTDLELLAEENRADPEAPPFQNIDSAEEALACLAWLMDRDRKSPALKSIQGRIWQAGYDSGELQSVVFADVPLAFERWRQQGVRIVIYSSGSVLAQKLLFGHTQAGDLNPFIDAYFDTAIGAKTDASSYARIAKALGVSPSLLLFVSDAPAELDAASAAGLQARLAVRPGNRAVADSRYTAIRSFDEL